MSIERYDDDRTKFMIFCDCCDETSGQLYDSFDEARQGKKNEGYITKHYANGYKDICRDCQD